jgi:Mn2+/Fe2+ NRAMP family transporter
VVLVTIALVLVQEISIRLGSFTGKGIAALIRERFSLCLTGLALFCVLLANVGLVVSEFAEIGQLYAAADVVDRSGGPEEYRESRLDAVSGALFACIISVTMTIATGARDWRPWPAHLSGTGCTSVAARCRRRR